jgi:hypothetical protein
MDRRRQAQEVICDPGQQQAGSNRESWAVCDSSSCSHLDKGGLHRSAGRRSGCLARGAADFRATNVRPVGTQARPSLVSLVQPPCHRCAWGRRGQRSSCPIFLVTSKGGPRAGQRCHDQSRYAPARSFSFNPYGSIGGLLLSNLPRSSVRVDSSGHRGASVRRSCCCC